MSTNPQCTKVSNSLITYASLRFTRCCDRKARAAYVQSFALWQQATTVFTCHDNSIITCSCHICGVVRCAHPVRGESHDQRNANGEVATTSPPFHNEPYWLYVLFAKVSHTTTSTSWSKHHFVDMSLSLQTCKLNRWIWFTLSYNRVKVLLRLVAAWDTKQAGDLWGDTVKFIASNLASHVITHNGNINRPLASTATCLYHDEETNISQKTIDRSVRQLAHDTTWKEGPCKTLRDRKYTSRNANRKMYPAQGMTVKSCDTCKRCVNMWRVCV